MSTTIYQKARSVKLASNSPCLLSQRPHTNYVFFPPATDLSGFRCGSGRDDSPPSVTCWNKKMSLKQKSRCHEITIVFFSYQPSRPRPGHGPATATATRPHGHPATRPHGHPATRPPGHPATATATRPPPLRPPPPQPRPAMATRPPATWPRPRPRPASFPASRPRPHSSQPIRHWTCTGPEKLARALGATRFTISSSMSPLDATPFMLPSMHATRS